MQKQSEKSTTRKVNSNCLTGLSRNESNSKNHKSYLRVVSSGGRSVSPLKLNNTEAAVDFLRVKWDDKTFKTQESLYVIYLNEEFELIHHELLNMGTINEVTISKRDIIGRLCLYSATYIIIAHNHPSGNLTPSQADLDTTKELRNWCHFVDADVSDHLIFSGDSYFSFHSSNLLN